ncbi:MAG: hypothetical protein U0V45_09405 [Flavobacteriales bacterium]
MKADPQLAEVLSAQQAVGSATHKERIESRWQLFACDAVYRYCWISYPQRKELKADATQPAGDAIPGQLDQLPKGKELKADHASADSHGLEKGWISYPQGKN